MLTEFLKLIQDTAVKASGATVVKVADHARRGYVVANGELKEVDVPPPLRDHGLRSVESLVAFAERFSEKAVIWHNEQQVSVVVDDVDRRDVATLPLVKSQAFVCLAALAEAKRPINQRAFIRILRTDLRNAGAEHVLSAVKRLEFKRTSDGRSNVEHGKESLGRSVEAAVNSAELIPESFTATIPVYTTPGADFHKQITCIVEIDAQNEQFVLLPDADDLAQAVHSAQSDLQERIGGELSSTPVYYGAP